MVKWMTLDRNRPAYLLAKHFMFTHETKGSRTRKSWTELQFTNWSIIVLRVPTCCKKNVLTNSVLWCNCHHAIANCVQQTPHKAPNTKKSNSITFGTLQQARRDATGSPGQSGHPEAPQPSDCGLCTKEFNLGLRPLRHFEEFLRIRPLQSEAPQTTRPLGNLPLAPPAGLPYGTCQEWFGNNRDMCIDHLISFKRSQQE